MSILSSSETPISQNYQLAYNEQGKVVTDIDSYEQSLKLILLTEPGSDVMRPDFGVGISSMVGQPLGRVRGEIKRKLSQQLAAYIPQVTVKSMTITEAEAAAGHLTVQIDWAAQGTSATTTVTTA